MKLRGVCLKIHYGEKTSLNLHKAYFYLAVALSMQAIFIFCFECYFIYPFLCFWKFSLVCISCLNIIFLIQLSGSFSPLINPYQPELNDIIYYNSTRYNFLSACRNATFGISSSWPSYRNLVNVVSVSQKLQKRIVVFQKTELSRTLPFSLRVMTSS